MFGNKRNPRYWITPGGQNFRLFREMAEQPHLLVAGATGTGKSVVLDGIILTILMIKAPCEAGFILIDPKRVELVQYSRLPHCVEYASEPSDIVSALEKAIEISDLRYKEMSNQGKRMYEGKNIYVIIDELADLMTTNKRVVMPLIQRLCQIGRTARIHVIAATQSPVSEVIPTPIK